MKFFAVAVSLISLAGVIFLFSKGNTEKVAYVDTNRILSESKQMISVEKEIESNNANFEANIDTLRLELEQQMLQYNKNITSMSDSEKKLASENINLKQQQFVQYRQAIQQKAAEEATKARNSATIKLNEILQEFGKMNNYKIILGTGNGNIIYAENNLDLTDQVIEYLNAN